MIYFRCGQCGKAVRATDADAGQPVACLCGHTNLCPEQTSARPGEAPADGADRRRPSIGWISAGVLLAAALGWGAWMRMNPAATSITRKPDLSPADARQQELLTEDIGKDGDPELMQLYRDLNARHFARRLPDLPVMWEPRLSEVGSLAAQAFTLEGMFGHIGKRSAILLNASLRADHDALTRALCHEMVHAFLYTVGDTTTNHGLVFQAELKRLSTEGAFTGIVATQAERDGLRAWLTAESARLDAGSEAARRDGEAIEAERRDLEQAMADMNARVSAAAAQGVRFGDQAAIDGLNARRDAYNRRVEEANARTERGREAVAEFNRQGERYKLMQSYPDGLDEEGLVTPRAASVTR